MRDLVIAAIVLAGSLAALRRPWVGVMLWTWISIQNPHRYAYGFALEAPLAAIAAVSTLVGLFMTRERESPFKGAATVLLAFFMLWVTLSWSLGLDPADDYPQWIKVVKIVFMTFVALALLHTKQHIFALAWVCAASLALLGAKGGIFTILNGGNYHVWGPPGTFIEDNNALALALVMTIPLLRFCQMQLANRWARHAMTAVMVLVAASALGSQSRGALLAIAAMALLMWWRGRSRFRGGILIGAVGLWLLAFMPEQWAERMGTINEYDDDRSALGRFSAWWVAWRVALHHPLGVGFNAARPELFDQYSPYSLEFGTPAAHSIYFQVLGNHGFVGLALFVALLVSALVAAQRIRSAAKAVPEARWCADLAGMAQVSLIGYMVGGAFLSLAYFDLPYNIIAMVALAGAWLRRRGWQHEPAEPGRWNLVPGLRPLAAAQPPARAAAGKRSTA